MRTSLAVALIALLPALSHAQTPATEIRWDIVSEDHGGVSGLDISEDGRSFVAVSDNGVLYSGRFERDGSGTLRGVTTQTMVPLLTEDGRRNDSKRHRDMEAVAIGPDDTRYVTIEGQHRILVYSGGKAVPTRLDLPKVPGVAKNTGFEALAVDPNGQLFALPESSRSLITPFPIYRRTQAGRWTQIGALPRRGGFRPVGADFGADGALYVLSRAFNGFAFATRVDRSRTPDDMTSWQEVFKSDYGAYDNLEGLATWRDAAGDMRVLMVSDDNFNWYQVTQFVEITLRSPLP